MAFINPYLNFDGKTEEAFNFYKSVFGGNFQTFQRVSEMPDGDKAPAAEKNRIIHVSLPIGPNNVLMGSDIMPSMGHTLVVGTNQHLSVNVDSEEDARRTFNALAAGGKISMPLDKMFWGALFGMLTDKFGINWMVNYDFNQKK